MDEDKGAHVKSCLGENMEGILIKMNGCTQCCL